MGVDTVVSCDMCRKIVSSWFAALSRGGSLGYEDTKLVCEDCWKILVKIVEGETL